MSSEPSSDIRSIDLDDYQLAVHISQTSTSAGDLVSLHGAGVTSESTWYPMTADTAANDIFELWLNFGDTLSEGWRIVLGV